MVFEINLLPEKYRKKGITIQFDARLLGGLAGVALAVLVIIMTVKIGKTLSDLREQQETLSSQKLIIERTAQRVTNQKREIQNINDKINTLDALGQRNSVQLQILEIVSNNLPENIWLQDFNQEAPRSRTGPAIGPDQVLNFRGIALLKEGVTDWIILLQEEELIQRVEINYLRPTRVQSADIFEFSLTAVMNVTG